MRSPELINIKWVVFVIFEYPPGTVASIFDGGRGRVWRGDRPFFFEKFQLDNLTNQLNIF